MQYVANSVAMMSEKRLHQTPTEAEVRPGRDRTDHRPVGIVIFLYHLHITEVLRRATARIRRRTLGDSGRSNADARGVRRGRRLHERLAECLIESLYAVVQNGSRFASS